jgi:hypothetical protein
MPSLMSDLQSRIRSGQESETQRDCVDFARNPTDGSPRRRLDTKMLGVAAVSSLAMSAAGIAAVPSTALAGAGSGPFCDEYSWPGNDACDGAHHHMESAVGGAAEGTYHCVDMYLDPNNNPHYTGAYCGTGTVGLVGVASEWGYPRLWPKTEADIWGSMAWGVYG